MFSKKRLVITLAFLAMAAVASAVYVQAVYNYFSQAGTVVVSSTPVIAENLIVTAIAGSGTNLSIYNATSAAGAVAGNLVLVVAVPTATANLQVPLNGKFNKGLVVSTAGSASTVTAAVSIYPITY